MYGIINDCFEKFILWEFGDEFWQKIVIECELEDSIDGEWVAKENYPDDLLTKMVKMAASMQNISSEMMVESFGQYFITYVRNKGYDQLLHCQGNTLSEWISNVHEVHAHLQTALESSNFMFPDIFAVPEKEHIDSESSASQVLPLLKLRSSMRQFEKFEGSGSRRGGGGSNSTSNSPAAEIPSSVSVATPTRLYTNEESIIVYHKSKRGPEFAAMTVGIVREVSRLYFGITVRFVKLESQGVEGSDYTVWRVIRESGPEGLMYNLSSKCGSVTKLSPAGSTSKRGLNISDNNTTASTAASVCPFSPEQRANIPTTTTKQQQQQQQQQHQQGTAKFPCNGKSSPVGSMLPIGTITPSAASTSARYGLLSSSASTVAATLASQEVATALEFPSTGLTGGQLTAVFPFHFAINRDFEITQIGCKLAHLIPGAVLGVRVDSIFKLTHPDQGKWDWDSLMVSRDSTCELQLVTEAVGSSSSDDNDDNDEPLKFNGGIYIGADDENELSVLFLVQPTVKSIDEMVKHKLTWSDFGKHSSRPKLILLAEHLKSETAQALKAQKEAMASMQSLEMKRMFVRYVSHEIRTPLNTVSMGLSLLERLKPASLQSFSSSLMKSDGDDGNNSEKTIEVDAAIFEVVEEIQESSKIAIELLNDLLLYEKLEGGLLALDRSTEPAVALVHEAVKMFNIQAKQAKICLECTQDKKTVGRDELQQPSILIDVDKSKISQVLRNLVSNALKFTAATMTADVGVTDSSTGVAALADPAKVIVHLSVIEADHKEREGSYSTETNPSTPLHETNKQAARFLRVEVIDFGPGISPENQAKLFAQIIQFDPNKLQGGNGSGIGLFISKGIMDLHDGRIGVYSEGEGKGATFYVDIPIVANVEKKRKVVDQAAPTAVATAIAAAAGPSVATATTAITSTATTAVTSTHEAAVYAVNSDKGSVVVDKGSVRVDKGSVGGTAAASIASFDDRVIEPAKEHSAEGAKEPYPDSESRITSPLPSSPLTKLKIMLVDDSTANRKMVRRVLTNLFGLSNEVVEAGNGAEMVDLIQQDFNDRLQKSLIGSSSSYQLVLVDFTMPVMDGPTATKRIRDMGFGGLIVGLTGRVLLEERLHFQRQGATIVLDKPLDLNKLKMFLSAELGVYDSVPEDTAATPAVVPTNAPAPVPGFESASVTPTTMTPLIDTKTPPSNTMTPIAATKTPPSDAATPSDSVSPVGPSASGTPLSVSATPLSVSATPSLVPSRNTNTSAGALTRKQSTTGSSGTGGDAISEEDGNASDGSNDPEKSSKRVSLIPMLRKSSKHQKRTHRRFAEPAAAAAVPCLEAVVESNERSAATTSGHITPGRLPEPMRHSNDDLKTEGELMAEKQLQNEDLNKGLEAAFGGSTPKSTLAEKVRNTFSRGSSSRTIKKNLEDMAAAAAAAASADDDTHHSSLTLTMGGSSFVSAHYTDTHKGRPNSRITGGRTIHRRDSEGGAHSGHSTDSDVSNADNGCGDDGNIIPPQAISALLGGGTSSGSVSPAVFMNTGKVSRVTPLPQGLRELSMGDKTRDTHTPTRRSRLMPVSDGGSDGGTVRKGLTSPIASGAMSALATTTGVGGVGCTHTGGTTLAAPPSRGGGSGTTIMRSAANNNNGKGHKEEISSNSAGIVQQLGRRLLGFCGIKVVSVQPSSG